MYKNDKLHGDYKLWSEAGVLLEHNVYHNGFRRGICQLFYHNGQLAIKSYQEYNKLYGSCKKWYENGQVSYLSQ